MAFIIENLIGEYSSTTGTGTYSFDGTAVFGMQFFDDRMASADTCYYRAKMGNDWEVGLGTFTSGAPDTLARTTILKSSNGDAAVSWGAGVKEIVLVVPASQMGKRTRQVFTSGSGTYTTPAGCTSINVRLAGAGGGGEGSGTSIPTNPANGGNTTFSTLTGGGGGKGNVSLGGSSGTAAGGNINLGGGPGSSAILPTGQYPGADGGGNSFGGAGTGGTPGGAGTAGGINTGGGGGGGSCNAAGRAGAGGGAGGYVESLISAPAATYSYAVGAGGTAGSAGTSGYAGGAGAAGIIIVDEFYN